MAASPVHGCLKLPEMLMHGCSLHVVLRRWGQRALGEMFRVIMGRALPPAHVTPAWMQEELDEVCLGGQLEQHRDALFKARPASQRHARARPRRTSAGVAPIPRSFQILIKIINQQHNPQQNCNQNLKTETLSRP